MTRVLYVLPLFVCLSVIEAAKWTHIGKNGTSEWSRLFPQCAGKSQSPINLDSTGDNPSFVYDPELTNDLDITKAIDVEEYYLFNNAHSAVVDTSAAEIDVTGAKLGSTYRVAGPHFHWGAENNRGSEHTFNGIEYPLEMHIVTFNRDAYPDLMAAVTSGQPGALAVVGVMFKLAEEDNPKLKPITDYLSQITAPDKTIKVSIPSFELSSLLPAETGEYFRYSGSLTTPECNEIVTWTVLLHPEPVSESQLALFRALKHADDGDHSEALVDNYRPVQPLNGRIVSTSFEDASIDLPVKKDDDDSDEKTEDGGDESAASRSSLSSLLAVCVATLMVLWAKQ